MGTQIKTMQLRNYGIAAFLLMALTALALLSIYALTPPAVVPASAPATDFSAERAMQHVQQIARAPHAMGTAEHAKVRDYLVAQMQQLNLNPQVQQATVVNEMGSSASVGQVYNVVGRLKGTGKSGKAVLLMAHYDSQPNALGAGDDGAGVAALLETARALQQSSPLQHDVIFLLTDGEEYGLFGAKAFREKHPWAKVVALVLNVEARGNTGPSMTFEMSPGNGWVARQFLKAAPYPYASSLAYEIYSRMPNDTDFTVFKEAGVSGLNSAFIDGFVHYHKATDSPENLNQNSLQHHGSNLLALTSHFASIPLNKTKAPDAVFFNVIGNWTIIYPIGLNILWVSLATLLLFVTFRVGIRKSAFTIKQVILGFGLYLVLLVSILGLFMPINTFVKSLLPYAHGYNGLYNADLFLLAYLLLALGLFLLLTWVILKWIRVYALLMGVFILWFILMSMVFITVPSATYVLLFPLLFSLGGMLIVLLQEMHRQTKIDLKYSLILLVASVPGILLLIPLVVIVFTAFELQLPVGPLALFLLLLGLLLPMLLVIERSFSWRAIPLLPLVLLLAGALEIMRAVQAEQPSGKQPLHSHASYYQNADTNKAFWVSNFQRTDSWNAQFFTSSTTAPLSEVYPMAEKVYLKNAADLIDVSAPTAEVLTDSASGGERFLTLKLASQRNAAHLEVLLQPDQIENIKELKIDGEPLRLQPIATREGAYLYFRYYGLPVSKEAMLEIKLAAGAKVKLLLYDQSIDLPETLVKTQKPPHVIAEQGRDSNLTVVRKTYVF